MLRGYTPVIVFFFIILFFSPYAFLFYTFFILDTITYIVDFFFLIHFHMFIDMIVDINIHHGGIMHDTPFRYIGGDVHEVKGYDVDFLSMWEVKELVHGLRYLNDVRCWYNVGADHEQVIPLNIDADVVNFLNIVEMYKFEVYLYVEHMVNHAAMVYEPLFFEVQEPHVGEGGGGVDEVPRVAREDGDGKGQDEQCEISQARNCKSLRVKTRATHTVTPSKKMTFTDCASPSEQPTTN
jgi:hypothetical protein